MVSFIINSKIIIIIIINNNNLETDIFAIAFVLLVLYNLLSEMQK